MEVIVSAKTVEDAVALGAKQLGKLVSEVEYEVIEEAKKGFLGMFSTEATVKVISKYTIQDKIIEFLNTLIKDMGVEAEAKVVKIEENLSENGTLEKDIHVDIDGKGLGMIIGRHGDVLDSIQYLCNIIAGRFPKSEDKHEYIRIVVDVENYRKKRTETLKALARRMADRVLNSGRNYTLEPMSGYERRIIHSEVQNINGVHTYSIGTEGDRRVVIAYGDEVDSTEE
ncbi:MAG: protein jag [Ruminococcaceae bacterium]|nr:protein jag [Oscillospiraceae bacterium]